MMLMQFSIFNFYEIPLIFPRVFHSLWLKAFFPDENTRESRICHEIPRLSTISKHYFAIYYCIILWEGIISFVRHRRRWYADAFLPRGWLGLAGLRRRFPRPVAHHRDATRLRITSPLRRAASRWAPLDGHRYVKHLYWSWYNSLNTY